MLHIEPHDWERIFEIKDFTDREKNAIALWRRGFCWSDIAVEMDFSRRTAVRMHKQIEKKMLDAIRKM